MDGDVDALTDAIEEMVDNYRLYKEQAERKSGEARRRHSGNTFIEKLWGHSISMVDGAIAESGDGGIGKAAAYRGDA